MQPDQERRLTFVHRFRVQEPKPAPNTYRRSGISRRRTSSVPTCRLNQIRSSRSSQLIGQIGRGQTTEKILVHSCSVKERTAAHGQSYRGTRGIGGDAKLIAVEPQVRCLPIAPPHPLFQLSGRLVRCVRKELLWIERLPFLEDRVDNPTELLGDERHRFAFAVA